MSQATVPAQGALPPSEEAIFPRPSAPPGPRGPAMVHGFAMLFAEPWLFEQCRRRFGDVFTLKVDFPFERLVIVADPAEVKRRVPARIVA